MHSQKQTTVYTIGHSTRPIDEFLAILKHFGIQEVVDIRTIAKSRHNPQYNQESLRTFLHNHHIGYHHMTALGGLRHTKADSINTGWNNKSFRGYADYMQTNEFAQAVEKLGEIAQHKKVVIMCAEAVPWRCHRSLVGDALWVRHFAVEDIFTQDSAKPHKLTSFAHVKGTTITYPGSITQAPIKNQ